MDFRGIQKIISRCLHGTFTGKVVVRIIGGRIVRCDVGSADAPMPYVSYSEAMRNIVNAPEPTPRPPEVLEAEAEAEQANVEWQEASGAYFHAEAALRAAERAAWVDPWRIGDSLNRGNPTYDASGRATSPGVDAARRALQAAEAKVQEAETALEQARARAHELAMAWERQRRREEASAAGAALGPVLSSAPPLAHSESDHAGTTLG